MRRRRRHIEQRRTVDRQIEGSRRLDAWRECFRPNLWWQTFADLGIDVGFYSHRQRPTTEVLPWDHVNVKKGRAYLEKEQERSVIQLRVRADAT